MVTPNVSKNAPNSSGGYVVDRSYTNRIYTPSELISPALKRKIKKGAVLSLRKEPSNKYDRNAVAVYWKRKKIGYLYQNGLRDIVMEHWKKKYPIEITFVSFSSSKSDESATVDFKFFKPNDGRSTQSFSQSSSSNGRLSSKTKNLPLWVWIIAALLLIGSCNSLTKKPTEEIAAPTESPAVVEALPSPEALEPTPIPETPEASHGPDYLVFMLSADDPGEYGVWKTMNADTYMPYTFIEFHIPAGRYSVRNSNPRVATQISIYEDGYTTTTDGWEEHIIPEGMQPTLIMQGETGEITVGPGQYVKLSDGSSGLWFDLLEKAPEADTLSAAAPLLASTLILKPDDFPDTAETRSIQETQAEETPVPTPDPEPETPAPSVTYVINTHTGKFHKPSCSSVEDIKPENRLDYTGTRDSVISMGYVACKRCHP